MKRITGFVLFILMAVWLLVAQSCLRLRISDTEAKKKFDNRGVSLQIATLQVQHRNLHYATTGCDTCATLLLLHGSPGSWSAYENYLLDSSLRQRYRLVSVDRPGFGYSDYGAAISISQQVPLIGALMTQLDNGKPVYVTGHSLGGPLAVLVAARYPSLAKGLMLFAASVDPAEETPEKWRSLLKTFPVRYFVPGAFRPSNIELWAFKKDVLLLPAALQSIRCPVVIIQGMKDPLVPPGNAFFAQKQLVNAPTVRMIKLADANHFIPWTRFDMLRNAMLTMDSFVSTAHSH